jgi:exodeoxyribonuclease VII large subunit
VGVVTSAEGDARHDIAEAIETRYPGMPVVLRHASVQGEAAPGELAAGLRALDGTVDVIVVGRGGGSDTDLEAFNTEAVAEAIVACETPVVAAVGHREDVTIADHCADASAITPTAAGEAVVPVKADELARLDDLAARTESAYSDLVRTRLDGLRQDLEGAYERFERDHEHEREKREAVEAAQATAGVPLAYKVALAVLVLLVLALLAYILL